MCINIDNPNLVNKLVSKAKQSPSRYRISAIAFNSKGEVLGTVTNSYSKFSDEKAGKGRGVHAERRLISRYGSLIKTIVICRIGLRGDIRPIDPCETCKKVADKYGIKIYSVK